MYKVQLGLIFRIVIKAFYQFGIWRNEEKSDFRKWCRRLLHLLRQVLFIIFVITSALLSDDKNQLIYLLVIAIGLIVLMVKLGYLLWRKDEILNFLYDPIVTHCISDYDESVEIKRRIEKFTKFIQVYSLAVIVTILEMVILPIYTTERMLPLFIRFDLECDYDTILYWAAYVYTAICCVLCVICNLATVLIWYIMYNYSIEYKLLGNQFKRLGQAANEKQERKKATRNSFQRDLINLIRSHQKLYDTIGQFRSCFSALFLVEIFTGSILICFTTYNLAYNTAENFFQMAYFVVALLYAFFDIFLIMYLANEITVESDRLSYCLFESNWVEQSQRTKKCVIIFCEMIKHPQELKVFIYPMNLEKFMSIVNGAYSWFNILKSFT